MTCLFNVSWNFWIGSLLKWWSVTILNQNIFVPFPCNDQHEYFPLYFCFFLLPILQIWSFWGPWSLYFLIRSGQQRCRFIWLTNITKNLTGRPFRFLVCSLSAISKSRFFDHSILLRNRSANVFFISFNLTVSIPQAFGIDIDDKEADASVK